MGKLPSQAKSLLYQIGIEIKLFWRSRQSVYLNFLVPMLGMALLVYLSRERTLEKLYDLVIRGLGSEEYAKEEISPMLSLTLGLIVYCIITVAFEDLTPDLVRLRKGGVLKKLGGTPLRQWVFLVAKTLSVSMLVFTEVSLVFAMGLISSEIEVAGEWWLLGAILWLGTFITTAMAFILSNLTTTVGGAVVAVHAVYIPMLFLCGAIVPVAALPRALRVVANVVPLTPTVRALRNVIMKGTGVMANGGSLLISLAWTVGLGIVAIRMFRWE